MVIMQARDEQAAPGVDDRRSIFLVKVACCFNEPPTRDGGIGQASIP